MEKFTATCLILAVILGLSISATRSDNQNVNTETIALPTLAEAVLPALDTFPKGKMNFTGRHKGQEIKTTVRDGKIEYLRIDGKEIPESDYKKYEPLVEEIMENVPPPPVPRAPKAIGTPPAPPAPPAPGKIGAPPAPPAPDGGYFYHESHELEAAQREIEAHVAELQARHKALANELGENWRQELEMNEKMLEEEVKHLRELESRVKAEHEAALKDHVREMGRHQEELKQLKKELELMEARNKELKNKFGQQLLKDKLIEEGDYYRLELTSKSLEVNGKKVADNVAEKYRKLFKDVTGETLCDDCHFSIGNTRKREE